MLYVNYMAIKLEEKYISCLRPTFPTAYCLRSDVASMLLFHFHFLLWPLHQLCEKVRAEYKCIFLGEARKGSVAQVLAAELWLKSQARVSFLQCHVTWPTTRMFRWRLQPGMIKPSTCYPVLSSQSSDKTETKKTLPICQLGRRHLSPSQNLGVVLHAQCLPPPDPADLTFEMSATHLNQYSRFLLYPHTPLRPVESLSLSLIFPASCCSGHLHPEWTDPMLSFLAGKSQPSNMPVPNPSHFVRPRSNAATLTLGTGMWCCYKLEPRSLFLCTPTVLRISFHLTPL